MRKPSPLPEPLASRPFSVADARAHGVGGERLRSSDLGAPFRGVRVSASEPLNLPKAFAARMLAHKFYSHVTAAQLHDLPLPARLRMPTPLHVSSFVRA